MRSMQAATAAKPKPIIPLGAKPKPFGLLMRLMARWRRWQRLRRDEALLWRQPDYLLRDIGVGRSEIERIIRKGRYR